MWFFALFSKTGKRIFLKFSVFIKLFVLLTSAKTACLKLFWFSRYFEKGSQPIRLLHFSNLNISWTTYVYTPKFCMVVDVIEKKSKIYFIVSRVCPNMPGHAHKCGFLYFARKLMQTIFLTFSEFVQLCVLLISAKTACLKLFSFLRYFEKGSQPIRLLHFSNLNISSTT